MNTLSQYLEHILGVPLSVGTRPGVDYVWSSFKDAKIQGASPIELANKMAKQFSIENCFSKVEVAGAGFVNLTLDDGWLATRLQQIDQSETLGVPQLGKLSTVVLDYSSPNVAKRMHVGHLRSTVIGAAIDRLHQTLGYTVIADNHIGDWGTQFGKLIVAYSRWLDPTAYLNDPIGELERLYVLFGKESTKDPSLMDEARTRTVSLQSGGEQETELWEEFVAISLAEYGTVYERLGVKFDITRGESFYAPFLAPMVQNLLTKGLAVESEGAVVVPTPSLGENIPPLLVQKKDGAFLYGTTDLATIDLRTAQWHPEKIIYVTDMRQSLHFKQVFDVAKRSFKVSASLTHVGFGIYRISTPNGTATISTREGSSISLISLLDEAHLRAKALLDNREFSELEKKQIAEAVGISSIIYADLSRNPSSDVTFDWNQMLSFEGNTAPYLLYALVRCRSIIRKGGSPQPRMSLVISDPTERTLALSLCRYPDAVVSATESLRPDILASYLYGLAKDVSSFHKSCRVIQEDGSVNQSRLYLIWITEEILSAGFRIIGIKPLDVM